MHTPSDSEKSREELLAELTTARARLAAYEHATGDGGNGHDRAAVTAAVHARHLDPLRLARDVVGGQRRSDERFHACIEQMLDCFAIFSAVRDAAGRIVDFRYDYINQAGCENNRIPLADHLGRGMLELLPAHRESGLFEKYVRVAETGEPLEVEALDYEDRYGPAGERRTIKRAFNVRAWRLDDGIAIAWRDVTSQRATVEALREGEQRHRILFETQPQIAWINRPDGSVEYFNQRWADYTGASQHVTGMEWLEPFHPEDRPKARSVREAAIARGEPYQVELRLRRGSDGAYRWHQCSVTPMRRPETGEIFGWLGTAADVHDIRTAEAALRDSEARFRQLADAMPQIVWTADERGEVEYFNRQWERYTGVPTAEALGTGFRSVVHPDDFRRSSDRWEAALSSLQPLETEHRFRRADGEYRWQLVRAVPVQAADARVRWFGTCTDVHDAKQAMQALREKQQVLDLAQAVASVGTFVYDIRARHSWWSAELERLYGLEPGSYRGTYEEWKATVLPEDLPAAESELWRCIETGTQEMDFRIRRRSDGQVRWMHARGRVVYDDAGQPLRMVGINIDITERMAANAERERLLKQLEFERARLAQVFREAPAFMCVLRGKDHVFEMANQQYVELTGRRDIADLLGKPLDEALPELKGQGFDALLDRVAATAAPYTGTEVPVALHRSPGAPAETRYLDFVYHPLVEADGSVSGVFVHGTDVTSQVHARGQIEDLARAAERNLSQMQAVIDTMTQGLVIANADGEITGMNPAALAMHGFASVADLYKRVEEYDDLFEVRDAAGRVLPTTEWPMARVLSGQTLTDIEYTVRRRDTGRVWVASYSGSPARDRNGNFLLAIVTIHDLTEMKRVQVELETARRSAEEANRIKDQFLAMLSHELRTPLTPVRAILSELRGDARLPQEVSADIAVAHRNIELESRLIDDLLDVSRIVNDKLELRTSWTDVHAVLREAQRTVADDMASRRHVLKTEFAATRPFVQADAARLQQVFWNLLRNAVKFTPDGGTITVSTSDAPDGSVRVDIADTGIGITPSTLARIFNPFEQGGKAITRTFGGLGLGLAISRSIVALHGGALTATSPGAGRGATFTVAVPSAVAAPPGMTPGDAAAPKVVAPKSPHAAAAKRRLLLVEDHADTARIMSRLLRGKGYDVTAAGNVASALDTASRQPFDLVVSDVGLPDGTGLELMRELQRRHNLRGIALTGYGTGDDVAAAEAAGFAAHLTKPVDFDQLLTLIERFSS